MFLLLLFFNDTATTEIYTLSLHDALPIYGFFKVCVKFITPLCMVLILYGQIKEFFF
mgnify:CR=1 FL=1